MGNIENRKQDVDHEANDNNNQILFQRFFFFLIFPLSLFFFFFFWGGAFSKMAIFHISVNKYIYFKYYSKIIFISFRDIKI